MTWSPIGTIDGIPWEKTLTRCDPNHLWEALIKVGKPTSEVGVLLEWTKYFSSSGELKLRISHEHSIKCPSHIVSCIVPRNQLAALVKKVADNELERFELSSPRRSFFDTWDKSRLRPTRFDKYLNYQQQLLVLLQQGFALPANPLTPLSLPGQEPQAIPRSGAPTVCVVDDLCNFESAALKTDGLRRVATLWYQEVDEVNPTEHPEDQKLNRRKFGSALHKRPETGPGSQPKIPIPGRSAPPGSDYTGSARGLETDLRIQDKEPSSSEPGVYREFGYMTPPPRWSHGSAVLDLIAGTSRWEGARLVQAPQAPRDVRFVQLPVRTVNDTTGGSIGGHVIDAIHHALEASEEADSDAEVVSRSVIVNISYGTNDGPHDGSSMFERALVDLLKFYNGSAACGFKTLHVVLPAGNAHLWRCHASGWLTPSNNARELYWKVLPDDTTDNFLEIWIPIKQRVKVTIEPPTAYGTDAVTVSPGQAKYWGEGSGATPDLIRAAVIFPTEVAQSTTSTMALLVVGPTRQSTVPPKESIDPKEPKMPMRHAPHGIWKITVTREAEDVCFHAWIRRGDAAPGRAAASRGFAGRQSYFLDPQPDVVDPRTTMNGIATAHHDRLYVVGSLQRSDASLSKLSAAGPNRLEGSRFNGPDVVEVADESLNLRGLLVHGVLAGSRLRVDGTSMAAAVFSRRLYEHLLRGKAADALAFTCMRFDSRVEKHAQGAPEQASPMQRGEFVRIVPPGFDGERLDTTAFDEGC